jgi:Ser/Thr protein kinase RdoA (MazF antagonist)
MSDPHPYARLTPEFVLDAVESTGRVSDLRISALNSFENRVYQVGIDGEAPIIAKFYRPERWSDEAILEEHAFSHELLEAELPVVAPLADAQGNTLLRHEGFRFALFTRFGGHAPEPEREGTLLSLGRILGRLHAIGASKPFNARPVLDIESFGRASQRLLSAGFLPPELRVAYDSLCKDLLDRLEARYRPGDLNLIRTHGDLHGGNILCRNGALWLVDFDDCRRAPAVQDLIGRRLAAMVLPIHTALPLAEAGRVRLLAVGSPARLAAAPQLPTFTEAGVTGADVDLWYGLLGPAGLPPALVERLRAILADWVRRPQTQGALVAQGMQPVGAGPADFARLIAQDQSRWTRVVRTANITAE